MYFGTSDLSYQDKSSKTNDIFVRLPFLNPNAAKILIFFLFLLSFGIKNTVVFRIIQINIHMMFGVNLSLRSKSLHQTIMRLAEIVFSCISL